jgi:hypothetical protein
MRILALGATSLLGWCLAFLLMSCEANEAKRGEPPIRIGWWRANKELYAYVFRPTTSNSCEVAVDVQGKIRAGPFVAESLPALLSLTKRARHEVAALKPLGAGNKIQVYRLVVDCKIDGGQTFTLQGPLQDMLKIFETCPALKQLLLLASDNQPKNYRIIDEPGPLKDAGQER